MQRRLVYSVALASIMLGACEMVEREEEVLARPEARRTTGISQIAQIPAARSVFSQEAALQAEAGSETGHDFFPETEEGRAPGKARHAGGCLDGQGRAALQQVLDGVWEGAENGCDLVAVLLQEGWHDRRGDRRRDSRLEYEQIVGALLADPLAANSGLIPPGSADPSAGLATQFNGTDPLSNDVIIDIIIPPSFVE